ncbi:hypothetical protein KKE75_02150 [Patescibacteria group bacterium]|nr:hypothetical protein [Patescibacteria group bacterium]
MCLVVPLKVKAKRADGRYEMETGRIVKSLVKNIKVGDYLICQQDLGIEKVSRNKVLLIRDALRQGL